MWWGGSMHDIQYQVRGTESMMSSAGPLKSRFSCLRGEFKNDGGCPLSTHQNLLAPSSLLPHDTHFFVHHLPPACPKN